MSHKITEVLLKLNFNIYIKLAKYDHIISTYGYQRGFVHTKSSYFSTKNMYDYTRYFILGDLLY